MIGRFQPLHSGHTAIMSTMKNPVIVIVDGEKSSLDTDKNPFSVGTRIRWIQEALPEAKILVAPNAYLPDLFDRIEKETGMLVTQLCCGIDRVAEYQKKLDKINAARMLDIPWCWIEEFSRTQSGTAIREKWRAGEDLLSSVPPYVKRDLIALLNVGSTAQQSTR